MTMSAAFESDKIPLTFAYKYIDNEPVYLDVYLPRLAVRDGFVDSPETHDPPSVPAVVYFHGGGLTVGNRRSWFPAWMQKRLSAAGYAFISADYRLIPPSTGYDVLADVKDVFTFISDELNLRLDQIFAGSMADGSLHFPSPSRRKNASFHVNGNAVAVAGTSAGGLCAYLASMHVSPKPKAMIGMYAMGGDFLTPHYLAHKSKPFSRGFEILDPVRFAEYLHPSSPSLSHATGPSSFSALPVITDSPLSYHPASSPTPGLPANPRMYLARLYLQLGVFLDYYTGVHEPSLSTALRDSHALKSVAPSADIDPTENLRRIIPECHHALFPQLGVTSEWPPTLLVHGESDTAVPVNESRHMQMLLERAGVPVQLHVLEGQEHSFDYQVGAEEKFELEFDLVMAFLRNSLK